MVKGILRRLLLILFFRSDIIKQRNKSFEERNKQLMSLYHPFQEINVFNLAENVIQPGLDWIVCEEDAKLWREYCYRGLHPLSDTTAVNYAISNLIIRYFDVNDKDTICEGWSDEDIAIYRQRLLSTMVSNKLITYEIGKNYSLTALLLRCVSPKADLSGFYNIKDYYFHSIGTGYSYIQDNFIEFIQARILGAVMSTKPSKLPE